MSTIFVRRRQLDLCIAVATESERGHRGGSPFATCACTGVNDSETGVLAPDLTVPFSSLSERSELSGQQRAC